ncbi:uncharacterized protein LOC119331168 [Triticum dicoccoides]|uniref:uncharacterized protein LOC119331168 n=1 Tax=Triticum dicoccoides TaxID=85692 RepID=UPI001891CBFA|nr:uncharacterized protein LOC119331168 [Triticum dicoccoides]
MSTNGVEINGISAASGARSTSVLPLESQDSMSIPNDVFAAAGCARPHVDAVVGEVCSEATSGWTRRVRVGKAPEEREMNPNRISALELSVRAYTEKRDGPVVYPSIGTSFDSLDEAYEFYNLYSWECGFGVRLAKSRLNVERKRCMQEIVCACAGKPLRENSRSARCGCNAMIRLLRSNDKGWYIAEHKDDHNHPLSLMCGQKCRGT